ncbi:MAG: tRNA-dihydrouridine synthase family protein, partial [Candidatus Taylorbacteria bacterium]
MAQNTAIKGKKNRLAQTKDFWNKLPKPFFVLAPMANVTDSVFRKLFAKYGKPDVTWTEFVSADGLISPGRKNLLHDLVYSPKERPVIAQLFTGHPEAMEKAATLVAKLGFDGIDINMGCPDRAVEKQGGGAASMKDKKNSLAVLEAARTGVLQAKKKQAIPVSVKTRIGYNTVELEWIKLLLEQKLPALTVHLRTRKEMSDVPAHWEIMPEIVKLRNEISPETLIIGNGDVVSLRDAKEKALKYGCDGVMIGRGIFGKPWFFTGEEKTPEFRLKVLLEHTKLFEKTY